MTVDYVTLAKEIATQAHEGQTYTTSREESDHA